MDRKRAKLSEERRRKREEVRRVKESFNAAMRLAKSEKRVELTELGWWERNRPPGY